MVEKRAFPLLVAREQDDFILGVQEGESEGPDHVFQERLSPLLVGFQDDPAVGKGYFASGCQAEFPYQVLAIVEPTVGDERKFMERRDLSFVVIRWPKLLRAGCWTEIRKVERGALFCSE